MMIGNGPVPRVGYSMETSTSLLRVASRSNADGMTPTGEVPMSVAYDGAKDGGGAGCCAFCCGDDAHPAIEIKASVRKRRFMTPPVQPAFECKIRTEDFGKGRIRLFVAKVLARRRASPAAG